ncbi:MAG: Gfo/Idh/MocA family oxidoreductase [Anaerolineae bacterium]|nr:Gfo/Idh/MocA family oxidoreductase [Anaerolineae bacterium]
MKVIQVGIGGMGNAWLKAVSRSDVVEFAGFVEISDEIAAVQVDAYNLNPATIFKSLPQALAALGPVDGIINVTPPQFHKDVTLAALDAGIPVLTEKPLAGTLADAQAMLAKANETGILLTVAQNYRCSAVARTVKKILDSGELGAIGAVDVRFFKGPHFGGFREEMRHPLIIDMAIHHFDMMRYFLDSSPASIYGRSWNPPWSWFSGDASAAVNMCFQNDIIATYTGSWVAQGVETPWNANWRFDCANGVLTIVDDRVYVQMLGEAMPPINLLSVERQGQDYLLHDFYEAVTSSQPTIAPAQDNIHTVEMVFAVVDACDTGQTIMLDK